MNSTRTQPWPRWWRRIQIGARRANFFAVMEIVSVIAFLIMTATTWIAVSAQSKKGQLLPSDLTATLLIGTLVPAMAILSCWAADLHCNAQRKMLAGRGGSMSAWYSCSR